MWIYISASLLLLICVRGQISENHLAVTIKQGVVIGSLAEDGEYVEFHGIPYADSTAGSHRFKAPSPPPHFTDAFIANRRNVRCIHALGVGYEGTEDCLVANVYTNNLNSSQQLPVMVWVKGKEFDKEYDHKLSFKNFLEHDVVVVSLNFRESIFGFLCLGTEMAPGNAGLKDIIAGLNWVQENIAQFGGDPSSVTLFGHGSGAAAIDLVSMSPMAEGLVHKVISQSGTASAPWAVTRDNLKYTIKVAEALGHDANSVEELSEVFKRTSVSALMAVINDLDLKDNALAFAPCIEKDNGYEKPFLTKSPHEILKNNEFLQIPFMTGFVDNEGTIRATEAIAKDWLEGMSSSINEFLQSDLEFNSDEVKQEVSRRIKSYYFANETIDFERYLKYQGDTMMLISAHQEVQVRARMSSKSVYLYQFSYKGSLGGMFVGPLHLESAEHSEELAYMFYNPLEPIDLNDLSVSELLLQRWTNFAKTGIPSSKNSNLEWHPFTNTHSYFLRIIDDDEYNEEQDGLLEIVAQSPHASEMSFWEPIYEEHFLDARSFWEVSGRDEGEGSTTDGLDLEGSGIAETTPLSIEETTPAADSATSSLGYTFTILALFAVLNHFHWLQITS